MKKFIVITLLGGAIAFAATPQQESLDEKLRGKTSIEKAEIKSEEIVKQTKKETFTMDGITATIVDVQKIDGGVQIFAKASVGGTQIGFGPNGTTETERFIIHNPPVFVYDPNGTVVREWTDQLTGTTHRRKLREDPHEAIKQALIHTMKVSGSITNMVISGSIGNTTSTFYPDANPESTSFDGSTRRSGNLTLSDIVNGIAGTTDDSMAATPNLTRALALGTSGTSNQYAYADHSFFLFDTSALAGQTVSSATFSVVGNSTPNNGLPLNATDRLVTLVSSNPASNTGLTGADHGTIGSTSFGTFDPGATFASWSTAGYNDITLNGSGISNISTTGVSKFGLAFAVNVNRTLNSTWASSTDNYLDAIFADTGGTTSDPKLVVVHAAAAPTNNPKIITIE